MNRWFICSLALVAALTGLRKPAEAQIARSLAIRPGDTVMLEGGEINYYRSSDLYIATNGVTVRYGVNVLTADKVTLDKAHGTLEATGDVVLTDGRSRFSSDRVVAHIDGQTGVVFGGNFFLPESGYRFSGTRIEKRSEDEYYIENGTLTTCDCGPDVSPSWSVNASRIRVTIGGYAQVTNGLFYIKGMPVFYLPYGLFPVKQSREFGLLFPNFTYSKTNGFEVHQGLFIPLGPSADATLWADYYSDRGYGASGEFRFVGENESYGRTSLTWIRQAFLEESDPRYMQERYTFRSVNRFNLDDHQAFVADIHTVSDTGYSAELGRTLEERTRQFTRSQVAYLNSGNQFSFLGRADMHERQRAARLPDLNRLPQAELISWPTPLVENGPVLTARATADHFVTKTPNSRLFDFAKYRAIGDRFDLGLRLEQPITAGPIAAAPYVGGRTTVYRPSFDQPVENRFLVQAGATLEAPFAAVFTFPPATTAESAISALIHEFAPVAEYYFTPGFSRTPPFFADELDIVNKRNLIQYGIENRFGWMKGIGPSVGYADLGIYRQFAFNAVDEKPNSPFFARLNITLPNGLQMEGRQYFDHSRKDSPFYHTLIRADGTLPGAIKAGVEYHNYRNYEVNDRTRVLVDDVVDSDFMLYEQPTPWASREIWLRVARDFFDHVSLSFATRYSIDLEQALESIYGFGYRSLCDCWAFQTVFIQRPNQDYSFNLTFTLTGIGSVGTR